MLSQHEDGKLDGDENEKSELNSLNKSNNISNSNDDGYFEILTKKEIIMIKFFKR